MVCASHRDREVTGSNPVEDLNFQASIRNYKYCVHICENHSLFDYSFNSDLDESASFKPGTISRDDVLLIAHELGSSWEMVGRVLKVPDAVIDEIEAGTDKVSKKCYRKCSLCSYKTMSYNT